MSHSGQCLCGGFAFEVSDVCGPFELCHCRRCGSPLPPPDPQGDWFEIRAGLFDTNLPIRPDKHIYVDFAASWDHSDDGLPRYTQAQIREHRNRP